MAEKKKAKYYQRPDGLFESIRTINGKRVAFRGKTCREVDRKILAYREEVERGWTFAKAADAWYAAKEAEVRRASYRSYGNTMRRLRKQFCDERITEIMPDEINAYLRSFERQGYSRDTVQMELSVLRMIFDYAINRRSESGLAVNPAASVKKSKGLPHKTRRALTEDEEDLCTKLAERRGGNWWLLGYFLMYTGCRRGEALALSYGDIDRENGVIHITKKLNYDGVNTPILEPFTKSENGIRDIPLLEPLAAALPRDRIGLLFPSPVTGQYFSRYETVKYWKEYCRDAGLVNVGSDGREKFPITPHCFRHSFATICYEAGIDARTAAYYLGDSVSVMEKVYVELRRSHKDDSVKQLNQFVAGRGKSQRIS